MGDARWGGRKRHETGGAAAVAQARPDGHSLARSPPFDYARDFAPVARLSSFPLLFLVRADGPARDLAGFVAVARGRRLGLGRVDERLDPLARALHHRRPSRLDRRGARAGAADRAVQLHAAVGRHRLRTATSRTVVCDMQTETTLPFTPSDWRWMRISRAFVA
jgi:hypothetical protein